VQDLIGALGAYGIRLMLYYHVGHDHWVEPNGWWARTGFDPDNPSVFINNWCAIMNEIGERYGEGLAGWFYDDGCVYYPLNPDFRQLTSVAKAGNPGRVICYNPWIWPRFTDFQDYFCGEGYNFRRTMVQGSSQVVHTNLCKLIPTSFWKEAGVTPILILLFHHRKFPGMNLCRIWLML
jgi:hypothetical protein